MLLLKHDVSKVLRKKVDYSTLFFFAWLFIVVWALEYNWIIILLANELVELTGWNESLLLLMFTMWSAILSVFIDNVPYNIAMVSTLEQFAASWVVVWVAWTSLAWWLNSCTSIGWAGSPIWAACNVIALWQAEKKWVIVHFLKYLMIWVPLVIINSSISYLILYLRYLF
jgi:Na+/H+ antiporter NhaD/arsenite permease-like protein